VRGRRKEVYIHLVWVIVGQFISNGCPHCQTSNIKEARSGERKKRRKRCSRGNNLLGPFEQSSVCINDQGAVRVKRERFRAWLISLQQLKRERGSVDKGVRGGGGGGKSDREKGGVKMNEQYKVENYIYHWVTAFVKL